MDRAAAAAYAEGEGEMEMEIGQRLRQVRTEAGLTQEWVAERVGVSRQTISNWENNRSYPDIVSVLTLSDLYSISLDELLKEDRSMIAFLETSTDVVKSRQRLSKLVLTAAYLVIWALSIGFFWLGGRRDAMGYSLVTFYLVLPLTTLLLSIWIGRDEGWTRLRWVMPLFFGLMSMLAPYATFSLANMAAFSKFNAPELTGMLPGILCSGAGIAVGSIVRRAAERRRGREAP